MANPVLDPAVNKGKSPELTEGRPVSPPGIYQHRDTGQKFITSPGEAGSIQADALLSPIWKGAWERVGDVPSRTELMEQNKKASAKVEAQEKATKLKKAKEALSALQPVPGTGVSY